MPIFYILFFGKTFTFLYPFFPKEFLNPQGQGKDWTNFKALVNPSAVRYTSFAAPPLAPAPAPPPALYSSSSSCSLSHVGKSGEWRRGGDSFHRVSMVMLPPVTPRDIVVSGPKV